jgi:DNA-binding transcriptional regulator YiaG
MDSDRFQRGPMLTDADRLLLVVRRMHTSEFARVFRDGLSAQGLMTVITALPGDRLNDLMDRARGTTPTVRKRERAQGSPLKVAIRAARKRAGMNQKELAAAVGVRQSSVSQWERGLTRPSTTNLLDLMRVFPGLADALPPVSAPEASGLEGLPGP